MLKLYIRKIFSANSKALCSIGLIRGFENKYWQRLLKINNFNEGLKVVFIVSAKEGSNTVWVFAKQLA